MDRDRLRQAQEENDVMAAFQCLRQAYRTDVSPLLAQARADAGGAIDPIATYRASQWRADKALTRKSVAGGSGIV